jgi:uncharacterized membrane protein YagU involved in acid resistance
MKMRTRLYILGLILIFQSVIFYPLSDGIGYTNFIKALVMAGFILICAEAFYALILAINGDARWSEFFGYLSGVVLVMIIGLLMVANTLHEINNSPHPPGDTTKVKTP